MVVAHLVTRQQVHLCAKLAEHEKFVQKTPAAFGRPGPERVVDLKDVNFIGYFDDWFGLDPGDTPLLLRNSGTSDIYALTLER